MVQGSLARGIASNATRWESELSAQEIQTLRGWVEKEYTPLQQELQRVNGRAKFRRLTRTEYANTFQDLFGIRPAVMQYLPEDGRIKGYDKVSGALPLSAASAEGYLKITDLFLETLFRTPKPNELGTVTAKAFPSEQSAGHVLELDDGWKVSFNTDKTSCPNRGFNTNRSGMHKLRMHVYGYQTDKPLPFGIYIGSTGSYPQILELAQVHEAPPGKPAIVETEIWLDQRFFNDLTVNGDSIRLIPFGLGVQVPKNHQASKCRGPGLAFKQIDIEQPAWPTPDQQWLLADFPEELLKELRSNYKPSANSTGDKKTSVQGCQSNSVSGNTRKDIGARAPASLPPRNRQRRDRGASGRSQNATRRGCDSRSSLLGFVAGNPDLARLPLHRRKARKTR